MEIFRKDSSSQVPHRIWWLGAAHLTTMLEEHSAAQQQCQPPFKNTSKANLTIQGRHQGVAAVTSHSAAFCSWINCTVGAGSSAGSVLSLAGAQRCLIRSGNITNTFRGHKA